MTRRLLPSSHHVAVWVLTSIASLLLAGCFIFRLPKGLCELEGLDKCPPVSLEQLTVEANSYSHATETKALECALGSLRSARPSDIHRTTIPTRVCALLADRHTDEDAQEQLAAEGVRWAEIALQRARGKEEGRLHYYLAVNLGIAVQNHTTRAIANLKRLAKELEVAKGITPDEDQGGPLRVLGMLYLVAPPWPKGIGDGDKALELMKLAVTRHPNHPLNHIFYAQALWEIEEEDAEEEVKKHIALSNKMLAEGNWGGAKERWQKLMKELAEEADVKMFPQCSIDNYKKFNMRTWLWSRPGYRQLLDLRTW